MLLLMRCLLPMTPFCCFAVYCLTTFTTAILVANAPALCAHAALFSLQTTMRLMAQQSLLQQLLATATSLAADVGRHMTPHHRGLPRSAEAAAASHMGLAAGYRHRFLNRINAYR
jgi:hypothetical protein